MTIDSVKDFQECINFYDVVCREDQTYFVYGSMIMTHNELINMVQTSLIVTDPLTNFNLHLAQDQSEWDKAALISLPRV